MCLHKSLLMGMALFGSLTLVGSPGLAADGAGSRPENTVSRSGRGDRSLGTVERVNQIIGKEVENSRGDQIGKIDDLVVDLASGRVLYTVVSVGGFVGIGDRLVAVPPGAFTPRGDILVLEANKQKLTDAPQYRKGKDEAAQMETPKFASESYKHFDQRPWWEGAPGVASERFENVHRASELSGTAVNNVSNEKIGDINNLIVDMAAGRVVFVIFAPDRSQDAEYTLYALPPNALTAAPDRKNLVTNIDRQKLAGAPGFNRGDWPDFSNQTVGSRIYQHYGKQAYFEAGGRLQPIADRPENTVSRSGRGDRSLGTVERVNQIIGKEVENSRGDQIGKIDDLIVDLASGRVLYTVVSVGGFVGIGDRLVAVPPGAFTPRGDILVLEANKQKLTDAPQYKKGKDEAAQMETPKFASESYKHFDQRPWWEGAPGATSGRFENVHRASELSGTAVNNVSNEKIGDINNLIVDLTAGRVVFVIFAPDRGQDAEYTLYALPPNALTAASDKKSLVTNIDRQKLARAPGFNRGDWPDFSNPSVASRIYQYYGKQAYFEAGGRLQPTADRPDSKEKIYHEPEKRE